MPGARHRIAMEQVIGPNFNAQQAAHQPPHRCQRIVDSPEQDGVVIERHAGAQERLANAGGLWSDLARVIEMRLNPHLARRT